jgi:hypothetical protein
MPTTTDGPSEDAQLAVAGRARCQLARRDPRALADADVEVDLVREVPDRGQSDAQAPRAPRLAGERATGIGDAGPCIDGHDLHAGVPAPLDGADVDAPADGVPQEVVAQLAGDGREAGAVVGAQALLGGDLAGSLPHHRRPAGGCPTPRGPSTSRCCSRRASPDRCLQFRDRCR